MSEKRDEEHFVLKLVDIIKDNLNTKITTINTRKDDGITLDQVDDNAYYYQTFGQEIPSYDPVVIFSVGSEYGETAGGSTDESISIAVQMVIADKINANSQTLYKTIVRYRRALKEILSENYSAFHGFQMIALPDTGFLVKNQLYFAFGVGLSFVISN